MDKILKGLIWPLVAVPLIYLALTWKKMPERVTMHFDWSGKPDRFGSRQELLIAAIALSAMSIIVYFLLTNIYRIDPKRTAPENKIRLQRLAFGVVVFFSALLCLIIYSSVHGNVRFNMGLILAGTGLLFAFIGNYMHNIKPNYFAGFRLPWTLENEENWKKTHALAGKLWFVGGLFLAITCLFLPPKIAMVIFISIISVITIIPIVFSYRFFVRHKKNSSLNSPL